VEIKAPELIITITDYNTVIRGAIANRFPNAKPQIYIFHININVIKKIKSKWNKVAVGLITA